MWRDDLAKQGIVFDADLLLTPQFNLTGGRSTGGSLWGNVDYTLNIDTQKLGLWPGGFFKFQADTGFGSNVFGGIGAAVPVNTQKEPRWLSCCPVWRLRREDPELPANAAGLELHGAALSSACRNPQRHLEIPRGAASVLSPTANGRRRASSEKPAGSHLRTTSATKRISSARHGNASVKSAS